MVALLSVLACAEEEKPKTDEADEIDPIVTEVLERCSDYAFRLCASAADCCESTMGPFSPEACAADFIADACVPASQAVGAGAAEYYPMDEEPCLAAWRRAYDTCTVDWEEIISFRREVYASCKMVRGTTPVGGGCSTTSTCEQPEGSAVARCLLDPITRSGRTCQVLEILGEGAACPFPSGDVPVCDVGLYCTTTQQDMPGTCEAVVPEGEACDTSVALNPECGLGNYCGLDDGVCHRATNFGGGSCAQGPECVSFQCEMSSRGGTCTEAAPAARDLCLRGMQP
jgi:hypothetical protein